MAEQRVGAVMVVGDSIGSVQACRDLANAGFKVYLVAPHPILCGQMPGSDKGFPTNDCEMCFVLPEVMEVQGHPNIEILIQSELLDVEGTAGHFTAYVRRYGAASGGAASTTESILKLPVGAVILAPNHKPFDASRRPELGYGRYANVVTSMDFDRILATAGPVAWLQCVGSRDRDHDYCSAVCCLEATKKAMMAKDYQPRSEHHIFLIDMRSFGKGYMDYYNRARYEHGIRYTRCRIASVTEDPTTKELVLRYETETGELEHEHFKLVVLSIGMEVRDDMKALAERLGVDFNAHGFLATQPFAPVETNRPGIYVCGPLSMPKDTHDSVTQASAAASQAASLLAAVRGTLAKERIYPLERALSPRADSEAEELRIGVFISQDGLGHTLDIPALLEYALSLPGVVHASDDRTSGIPRTRARIQAKIAEMGLNRIVVATGTPHIYETFYAEALREAGLNPYLLAVANIREQCAWVHATDPGAATAKAKDLIRMAVARVRLQGPLPTETREINREALVIGGGVAGMNAALSLAQQGYRACLIEREAELGGNLRHIYYDLDGKDVQAYLCDLIAKVESDPQITVLKRTTLVDCAGSAGAFISLLQGPDGQHALQHGVIIIATGGQENRPPDYLLGQHPDILTQRDLEKRIVEGDSALRQAKEIVMIQCVGPAEKYCSRLCCSAALKNSLKIKELNPDCAVYVLYKDIRAYGFREQYYTQAREQGVVFIRYDDDHLPQVSIENGLAVQVREQLLARDIVFRPDFLVLSEAMIPAEGNAELAEILHVPLNDNGFFVEAHPKLQPVDFAAAGIFCCGIAHNPKSIEESIAQAQAAAARAATILSQDGWKVGGAVAVVDETKCVGCLTCVRICPFDAPRINPQKVGVGRIVGAAEIDVALCRGCGLCVAECPDKAIQLQNYRDDQILAEIEAFLTA